MTAESDDNFLFILARDLREARRVAALYHKKLGEWTYLHRPELAQGIPQHARVIATTGWEYGISLEDRMQMRDNLRAAQANIIYTTLAYGNE